MQIQSLSAQCGQRPLCHGTQRCTQARTLVTAGCQQQPRQQHGPGHQQLAHRLASASAGALVGAALLLGGPQPSTFAAEVNVQGDPVYDSAGVLKPEARQALSRRLAEVDRSTGYHVRVFAEYQMDKTQGGPTPRGVWGSLDNDTVVVIVDPSAPNILNVGFVGDNVLAKLHRPFWTELQSRYGNMFYVREQGESAALLGAMSALTGCLEAPGGCRVVPGLPLEQYYATLTCSVAGGLVAGFVSKIEPQGIVQRRWVWLLLFSPLWGSLFVSFGLGPIVSRTDDAAPLAANTAAFLAAAAAPGLLQRAWGGEEEAGAGGGGGGSGFGGGFGGFGGGPPGGLAARAAPPVAAPDAGSSPAEQRQPPQPPQQQEQPQEQPQDQQQQQQQQPEGAVSRDMS